MKPGNRQARARRCTAAAGLLLGAFLFARSAAAQQESLLDAVRRGDTESVRSLLRSGADANVAQGDGITPLHLAAERGDLALAKLLLDAKARVEAKTRIGAYTPLHLASQGGHADVVEALLGAGADPASRTTNSGVTPLHLAAMAPNGERAAAALLEKGAPVNALEAMAGQKAR